MLLSVALFSVPGGLSDGAALLYAYLSYALFGLASSLVNIPFGSLSSACSLTITTLVLAVVGIALYLFAFKISRETVERDAAPVSLKQSLAAVRHNRPLILLCLSALFMLTGMFILQTLQVYYARDVLGSADYQIVLTWLPAPSRRWGRSASRSPLHRSRRWPSSSSPCTAPASPRCRTVIFALQADTVEYGEWETGVRTEGSNYAIPSFSRKVGQASAVPSPRSASGRRLRCRCRDAVPRSPGRDPVPPRPGAGPLRRDRGRDHAGYPLTEERFREVVREIAFRRADRAGARDQLPGSEV